MANRWGVACKASVASITGLVLLACSESPQSIATTKTQVAAPIASVPALMTSTPVAFVSPEAKLVPSTQFAGKPAPPPDSKSSESLAMDESESAAAKARAVADAMRP